MNELINAYNQTHYKVNIFKKPILVGQVSGELEAFLAAHDHTCWAYITAFNPRSVLLSAEENENRNGLLRERLGQYTILDGIGIDSEEKWPGENSFLVFDIQRVDAILLAKQFEQNAIVFGLVGKPAELVITLPIDN